MNGPSLMVFPDESPAPVAGGSVFPPAIIAPALVTRSSSTLDRARAMEIKTQLDLDVADAFRQDVLAIIRQVEESFNPHIARANDQHKALIAEKKKFTEIPMQALEILKPKIAKYIQDQDEARLQAEREAELKRQEAKRLKGNAVTEAWGLVGKDKPAEAEKVLAQAAEKAAEIQAAAPPIPEKPRANVSLKTIWDFEIVDAKLIPRQYLVPDLIAIGKAVRWAKDQAEIPGVRVIERKTIADRGSRR